MQREGSARRERESFMTHASKWFCFSFSHDRYLNLLKYASLIRREKSKRRRLKLLQPTTMRQCTLATLGPVEMPFNATLRPFAGSLGLLDKAAARVRKEKENCQVEMTWTHFLYCKWFIAFLSHFLLWSREQMPSIAMADSVWETEKQLCFVYWRAFLSLCRCYCSIRPFGRNPGLHTTGTLVSMATIVNVHAGVRLFFSPPKFDGHF